MNRGLSHGEGFKVGELWISSHGPRLKVEELIDKGAEKTKNAIHMGVVRHTWACQKSNFH